MAQLPGRLKRLNKKLAKAIVLGSQRGAKKIPGILRKTARSITPYPPEAFGKYRRGWRVELIPKGARVGNNEYYAQFVETGRRPGKGPPLEALIKWALLKRFKVRKLRKSTSGKRSRKTQAKIYIATRIAWALFWKIKKHGVKGRYVVKKSMPEITRVVGRSIKAQMSRVVP